MEETRNLAEELQKPQVETFDTTELTIIAAIRKGFNTLSAIQEETTIKEVYAKNVIKTLVECGYLLEVPGAEESTYMIKYKENHEQKKLRLPGSLILPVSTFRDSNGKRWVTRGRWHEISDDIDVMNDIEWYDDTENDAQMKTVMKMVSNKKRSNSAKTQADRMKDAGEAPEEIKKWMDAWAPICDHLKLKVIKGGSSESLVTISPRIATDAGAEFPWGTISNVILPNQEILGYIDNKNYSKPFDIENVIQNFKRIRAFKSVEGNIITFGDFFYKKSNIMLTVFERNMTTGKDKAINSKAIADTDEVRKLLESDYQLFLNIIKEHNEKCNG